MTGSSKAAYPTVAPARRDEIAELAEAVAAEHAKPGRVDPYAVLASQHITCSCGDYADAFDGMLELKGNKFHVYCNLARVEHRSSTRARFTIGHELGHFFIDDHRQGILAGGMSRHPSFCEFESKNVVEYEADLFASSMLMPRQWFVHKTKACSKGLGGILALANHFGVSLTSAAIRYADLEVLPCIVIKWSADGYAWKWLSKTARYGKYFNNIRSLADVPNDAATARIASGQKPPPGMAYMENGSTAAAWYKSVAGGSFRDVMLMEQAISLGRFGVLTFLYPLEGGFPDLRA